MRISASIFQLPVFKSRWALLALLAVLPFAAQSMQAQNLSNEGPTGLVITPTAYVAPSLANGLAKPTVGYHMIAGGPEIGDFNYVSVTEGFAKRFEFGYTAVVHAAGSSSGEEEEPFAVHAEAEGNYNPPSSLWSDFNIVHAKVTILPENFRKIRYIPAIAVGGVYRFNDQFGANLNYYEIYETLDQKTTNGDIYLVATKSIPVAKPVSALLSLGLRGTNSSMWGLGGNAPGFQGKLFGAAAVVLNGPRKSTITIGTEVSEQPKHLQAGFIGYVGAPAYVQNGMFDIPTSESYFVRFAPPNHKLSIDLGVLHLANDISNEYFEATINAEDRATFGLSYSF